MRLPYRTSLLFTLCLWAAAPVRAQQAGLAFLRIGTDAASVAMGDANVAYSRDAFSTYWNPAGLAAAGQQMAALSHLIWISGVRMYGLSARFQAGQQGGWGLFLTTTGNASTPASDGLFDVQFLSAGAAYGHSFGSLRAGVTAKYLYESVLPNKARGYAFDFGLQLEALPGYVLFGAALQNLGSMTQLGVTPSELPTTLRGGATVFPLRVLTAADDAPLLNTFVSAEVSRDFPEEATQFHLGASAEVVELVMVRAGYLSRSRVRTFTLGFGLQYEGLVFDYALIPFANDFEGLGHMITLFYRW